MPYATAEWRNLLSNEKMIWLNVDFKLVCYISQNVTTEVLLASL